MLYAELSTGVTDLLVNMSSSGVGVIGLNVFAAMSGDLADISASVCWMSFSEADSVSAIFLDSGSLLSATWARTARGFNNILFHKLRKMLTIYVEINDPPCQ